MNILTPTKEQQRSLDKAKIRLMTKPDTVFFSELVFSHKTVWTDSIPTAGVNGVTMFFNPEFWNEQSEEQQLGLLVHEALHTALMHITRKGVRDSKIHNIAADHVINIMITDRGFKIPDGGYCDYRFRGMHTNQVYDILMAEKKTNPLQDLNGDEAMDGIGEDLLPCPEGLTPKELEDRIEQTVVRASIRSEQEKDSAGTIPGDIKIFLNGLLKPKLPWDRLLLRYMNNMTRSDYSMAKPNRKYLPEFYLPTLSTKRLSDIAFSVDSSGSVSDDEFKQFISDTSQVIKRLTPEQITFIQFDTKIHSVNKIKSLRDLMNLTFTGRGGTDVTELIEWANKNKPELLVVFTDGAFIAPKVKTKVNTLWIIHNNKGFVPPFGHVIHYTI